MAAAGTAKAVMISAEELDRATGMDTARHRSDKHESRRKQRAEEGWRTVAGDIRSSEETRRRNSGRVPEGSHVLRAQGLRHLRAESCFRD